MTADQTVDRFASARAVADAVLYEGYVLYPYRASSKKNQLRWQFGVLSPRECCAENSSDRFFSQTECLVESRGSSGLHVRVRFLQVQHRFVEGIDGDGEFHDAAELSVDGDRYLEWEEAVERVVELPPLRLPFVRSSFEHAFGFTGDTEVETINARDGAIRGRLRRCRQSLAGKVVVTFEELDEHHLLYKVGVRVENTTSWSASGQPREEVVQHSLVGVHTMLAIDDGRFVSLLDPPAGKSGVAARCRSEGTYPVLIGNDDVVLSSPIILYDHPEIAPESPGDLFDATEIDEILALRVITLTEEERAEARGTDPRSAAIIDRCDEMSPEIWERLHGTMRSVPTFGETGPLPDQGEQAAVPWWDPVADASVDPWNDSVIVAGIEVRKGSAVILHPSRRSDAQDLFYAGLHATVAGVFKDVDGEEHVAVTVDDDPANSEFGWQGRYLFFYPDEVEPCATEAASS